MSKNNDLSLLKLSCCPFVGPAKIKFLEDRFKNLEDIFSLPLNTLLDAGLNLNWVEKFISWRKSFDLNKILFDLRENEIKFISWHSPYYPKLLKEIHSAPSVLFYQGKIESLNQEVYKFLSVVGSRRANLYAEKVIQELLNPLLIHNLYIVSGLAYGVDSLAHQLSVKNKTATCAVLGSGLSNQVLYPRENIKLAQQIIEQDGLLISEFPPLCSAHKTNFPRRNRIIAGLSPATLVIQADKKSGALITANFALENNRDILTVPGNIFEDSLAGNNKLIQSGATPILNSQDLMLYFNIEERNSYDNSLSNNKIINLNDPTELIIYQHIESAYKLGFKIDNELLCQKVKLDTAQINSTLTILELKNIIIKKDSFWYPYY